MIRACTSGLGSAFALLVCLLCSQAKAGATESPGRVAPALSKRTEAHSIRPSVGILVGSSLHIKGLNYGAGLGIRGGINWRALYLGTLIATHSGDELSINYGAAGVTGGRQEYRSSPLLVVADIGYLFEIGDAAFVFRAMPNLSAGLLSIPIHSNGVYGESTIRPLKGILGIGLSVGVLLNNHVFVGAHARAYNTGDTSFRFGDVSNSTYRHGFSTSIFYDAIFGELGYCW